MDLTYSLVYCKIFEDSDKVSFMFVTSAETTILSCTQLSIQFAFPGYAMLPPWKDFPLSFSSDNHAYSSFCTIQFKHHHLQEASFKWSRSSTSPHRVGGSSTLCLCFQRPLYFISQSIPKLRIVESTLHVYLTNLTVF